MKEQKKQNKILAIGIWLLCVIGLLNSRSLVVQAEDLVTEDGYRYIVYNNGTIFDETDDKVWITGYIGNATAIEIPGMIDGKRVTSINGEYAFRWSLISVTIPNSVTYIGERAFAKCSSLTSITIPDSVTYIGEGAFWGCSSLTSVSIPPNVDKIHRNTFYECSSLRRVTIPDSVIFIESCAFWKCSSLISITLPKNLYWIASDTFAYCTSLKSVTILSKDFDYIGNGAFEGCKKLKTITIKSTKLTKKFIGKNALKGTNKKLTIKVPKKMVKKYKSYFKNKGNKTVKVKKG